MKYGPTGVAGVMIIDIEPTRDDRGFSSDFFCTDEFADYGISFNVARTSVAYSYCRGTLRGICRQVAPNAVATLVRCTRGAVAGVALDVRPESPTYREHVMLQMSADNRRALFVPPYVGFGFQTLADNTEVLFQVSDVYETDDEQGFRWNDPEFGIDWPLAVSVISEKDAHWPLLASVASVTPLAGKAPHGANKDALASRFGRSAAYGRGNRPA